MGRGRALPSLLVLSLTSGAGAVVLVIAVLGSLFIGSPFIVQCGGAPRRHVSVNLALTLGWVRECPHTRIDGQEKET